MHKAGHQLTLHILLLHFYLEMDLSSLEIEKNVLLHSNTFLIILLSISHLKLMQMLSTSILQVCHQKIEVKLVTKSELNFN